MKYELTSVEPRVLPAPKVDFGIMSECVCILQKQYMCLCYPTVMAIMHMHVFHVVVH